MVAFIFRYGAHYRASIYNLIDEKIPTTFFFANNEITSIKKMDYFRLSNCYQNLKVIKLPFGFYYIKGMNSININDFNCFVFAGDIRDISSWLMLIRCKSKKKKTLLWSHGWYGCESIIIKSIKKLYYSLATGVLLYGNYAKNLMIKNGFRDEKISVIYNSLDYEKQINTRALLKTTNIFQDHFGNHNPTVIFIGRLTKEKQLQMLLNAILLLRKEGVFMNLVLIGDGVEKGNLLNLSQELCIDHVVWFYGECYNEFEIGQLIYNAFVCVSPGNVGLTAMHSLVYGTPVITHNDFSHQVPEFESIEEGKTGAFFVYRSIESLSNTIKKWLKSHPHKNDELIHSCQKVIEEKYNPYVQLKILMDRIYD